jgi:hypothetical protein
MRSSNFGWRRFLLKLAFGVHEFIDGLTSKDRESVLILDDSTIERPRSKKVELLAKVHDHTTGRFLKGFKLLTLAWSDGSTLLPLDFALRSSANKKQRYQEVSKDLDKRSCGARRRQEAVTKSTELVEPMIVRALKAGIKVKYLLMDSWFAMPTLISDVCKHIPVICMVNTPKIHYIFEGQKMDVTQIYSQIRKRRGRAKILANAQAEFKDGLKAKLVFVRNKHKRDWLALLTTNVTLADEDVVRIYGKQLGHRGILPHGQAASGTGERLPKPGLRCPHSPHDHRDDPVHFSEHREAQDGRSKNPRSAVPSLLRRG